MASSQEFVEHVLDLLAPLGRVEARRMFGGHGVYARGAMLGLLDDDELFLKTDEATRPRFVEAGCRRWTYGPMRETSYFRPPDEAHEDAAAMLPWARLALDAALRTRAAAAARAAGRERRRKETAPARAAKAPAGRGGAASGERGAGARKPASVSVRRAGKATPAQREGPDGARVRRAGRRRPR